MLDQGTLYVCATPIGNLKDITLRVLDTLREVDLIAAEDTRHSLKLLQHYSITTPLTSYHEHNEKNKAPELLSKLKSGQTIALISDAGMPGISDPGYEIIRICEEENVPVDVLPGPNAALTALVLSGMPTTGFAFQGFLPAHRNERKRKLEETFELRLTQIYYEAPHRLLSTLKDMLEIFEGRKAAVVRELTKLHQSVHKGLLADLVDEFEQSPARGECCILLEPYIPVKPEGGPGEWRISYEKYLAEGMDRHEAMKIVAKYYGIGKREVYKAVLEDKE